MRITPCSLARDGYFHPALLGDGRLIWIGLARYWHQIIAVAEAQRMASEPAMPYTHK